MSSKSRAAAVAAVRTHIDAYTKPRWPQGEKPHTTLELLSGAEFIGGDAFQDALAFLAPLLDRASPHKIPRPLSTVMKAALAKPSVARFRDVEDACLDIVRLAEGGRSPVLVETFRVIEDLHERCAVWSAALGCTRSAKRCAMLSLRYWRRRPTSGFVDVVTYGLMRSMLDYLATADVLEAYDDECRGEEDPYIPEGRHVQLETLPELARGIAHVLGVVHEAIDQGWVEESRLQSEFDALADLAETAALAEDRAGIKRQAAPPAVEDGKTYSAEDLPAGPGLVVVGDVSHLAKGRKGDNDPLKEAAAIVGTRLPLVTPPADLQATRAELMAEFPQLERVTDRLLRPLAGQDSIRLPHVLLWGPPGAGKTRYSRRLAEVLGLRPSVLPLAGATDSLTLAGTPKGWSTANFSAPVRDLIRTRIANPAIVVDEIDKVGRSRTNGNPLDVLVNMLGVETAARYRDPYLQADVDLSRVNWIVTGNGLDTIPAALLDRFLVLRVDEPGPEHLRILATSILAEVRADRGLDERWAPAFDAVEWAALETHWAKGGSLRALRRLVEAVLDARDAGPRQ